MSLLLLFGGSLTVAEVGSSISGGTFSRKKWREIKAAQDALVDVENRAIEIKAEGRRLAALKAARLAEKAIELAQAKRAAERDAMLGRLTAALEGAARASKAAEMAEAMRRVEIHAKAMIRIAEDEDDELALELILLH